MTAARGTNGGGIIPPYIGAEAASLGVDIVFGPARWLLRWGRNSRAAMVYGVATGMTIKEPYGRGYIRRPPRTPLVIACAEECGEHLPAILAHELGHVRAGHHLCWPTDIDLHDAECEAWSYAFEIIREGGEEVTEEVVTEAILALQSHGVPFRRALDTVRAVSRGGRALTPLTTADDCAILGE
jgi:hypothetical protein